MMCDVIILLLHGQLDIPCFTVANLQLDEYLSKPNFPNQTKFE